MGKRIRIDERLTEKEGKNGFFPTGKSLEIHLVGIVHTARSLALCRNNRGREGTCIVKCCFVNRGITLAAFPPTARFWKTCGVHPHRIELLVVPGRVATPKLPTLFLECLHTKEAHGCVLPQIVPHCVIVMPYLPCFLAFTWHYCLLATGDLGDSSIQEFYVGMSCHVFARRKAL